MSTSLNTHGTFPRSKRFVEPIESQVPGPGTYNPLIDLPDAVYKKGAMLEKAGRFIEREEGPDTFGLYGRASPGGSKENRRPRTVSASSGVYARGQSDDKQRLISMHDKEISRLQLKLVKLEAAKEESSKERLESRTEVMNLKSEIRTLTQQLLKSSTSLTKHTTSLPLLQKKYEELTTSYNASSKKKDVDLSSLTSQVTSLHSSLSDTRSDLSDSTSLQHITSSALVTLTSVSKRLIDTEYSRITKDELSLVKFDSHTGQLRILRLEKQLLDRLNQVSALVLFATEKEEELLLSDDIIKDLESELEWRKANESNRLEEEIEARLREKEWRRRCRAYEREIGSMKSDLDQTETELTLANDWEEIFRHESDLELDYLQSQIEELEQELDLVESEYTLATEEEIPRLLSSINQLTLSSEKERETLYRTERSLRELMEREREERERREGEIEELTRRLGERERESERERGERKRILGLLGTTRSSECGLREELEEAKQSLARLESLSLQSQHLNRTVDELARRNAAAENDVLELSELNSELISHGNPNQKIRHLVHIREQLAESKRLHLQTTSLLASSKAENASLLLELSAYRSVPSTSSQQHHQTHPNAASLSSFPLPPNHRTKVQRPDLGDVFTATTSSSLTSSNASASNSASVSQSTGGRGSIVIRKQVSIAVDEEVPRDEWRRRDTASVIHEEDEEEEYEGSEGEYDDEDAYGSDETLEDSQSHRHQQQQQQQREREKGIAGRAAVKTAQLQVQATTTTNSGLGSLPGSPGGGVRMEGRMKVSDLW